MSGGAAFVQRYWPEAWDEFRRLISVLAPLEAVGLRPHNASVHGFRGLITSSPRPSYLAAQTLLHETGHNKFSSIYDLFILFDNEEGNQAYSPFVGTDRPLSAVSHGIFAFLQDVHISLRLRGQVDQIRDLNLDRYIDKRRFAIDTAIGNLKRTVSLAERGRQLMAGFEKALATTG